jgi:hypothetical protein
MTVRRYDDPEHADRQPDGRWGVWCEVWGSATGSRASWLKHDGKLVEYASREEAETEANRLMQRFANNPYRKADFSYSARPLK